MNLKTFVVSNNKGKHLQIRDSVISVSNNELHCTSTSILKGLLPFEINVIHSVTKPKQLYENID